jgi:hypothetical protein
MFTNDSVQAGSAGPSGWRQELAYALGQPELAEVASDTEPVRRAAYWLAVVLGNCRLRELDLGESDGSLPVPIALAAGRRLAALLEQWGKDAGRLEERLQGATEPEANDACFDLLEARMEAWAAFVAIDEAYQARLARRQPGQVAFVDLMEKLLDRIEGLDRRMKGQVDLLSLVAQYPLLDNWKRSLGPTYAQVLPWWLDGTLEATAAQMMKVATSLGTPIVTFVRKRHTLRKLLVALAAWWAAHRLVPAGVRAAPSAGTVLPPERAALAATAFGVELDDVDVRLDLDRDRRGGMQLRVHVGPPPVAGRYAAVALGRPTDPRAVRVPLVAGIALVPLADSFVPDLDLGLLETDTDGAFHLVHPKESRA